MNNDWEAHVTRWSSAGVIDAEAAGRIRDWEAGRERPGGLQWPVAIALVFGALLLGAGILLFVSAHWDELSPAQRMALVVAMVAVFHVGGAVAADRFEGLSIALHAVGTVTLGAGIALAGQIFHLSEHWPAAVMLWALGAVIAWALLRHWAQGALAAVLIPYWLCAEWSLRMADDRVSFDAPIAAAICALSFTYLTARRSPLDSPLRNALCWIGAIALLPSAVWTAAGFTRNWPGWQEQAVAWTAVVCLPIGLAAILRGRQAVWNVVATAWIMALVILRLHESKENIAVYAWCALGAAGLTAWGVREGRPERINLGIAGFALTILVFYFSSVMDKLGRSASLIALGLLFLGGGWLLERMRRRLIAQIIPEHA